MLRQCAQYNIVLQACQLGRGCLQVLRLRGNAIQKVGATALADTVAAADNGLEELDVGLNQVSESCHGQMSFISTTLPRSGLEHVSSSRSASCHRHQGLQHVLWCSAFWMLGAHNVWAGAWHDCRMPASHIRRSSAPQAALPYLPAAPSICHHLDCQYLTSRDCFVAARPSICYQS